MIDLIHLRNWIKDKCDHCSEDDKAYFIMTLKLIDNQLTIIDSSAMEAAANTVKDWLKTLNGLDGN